MRANSDNIAILQRFCAFEKISFLVIVSPPRRPIILSLDKIPTDFVQSNVTLGFLLNDFIAADMITMSVGADN